MNEWMERLRAFTRQFPMFTTIPTHGVCHCGRTFVVVPANKKHCSVRCAKATERRARAERLKAEIAEAERHRERPADKYKKNPTVEQLNAMETLLLAGGADGQSYYGVVPEWTPHDPRVLWCEAAGEPGVWNMVVVPTAMS